MDNDMDGNSMDTPSVAFDAADLEQMFKNAQQASTFLKALSHEHRLMILCLLMQQERTVGELEGLLGIRQSNVSQQLQRLRGDRLVSTRRDGKQVYYTLSSQEARAVISVLYDLFCSKLVDTCRPVTQ